MEQLVRVQKNNDDGTAQVIHVRQSACSGDCHKCSGCGAATETLVLTAQNPIGAKPGDIVVIQSASGSVLAAAAILYILPLVMFFLGYALGAVLWERGGLVGCLSFIVSMVMVILYDRYMAKHKQTTYTITGIRKES